MYAGYTESEERAAARWALMCKRAEKIAAEKAAQLSNISPETRVTVTREG